MKLSKSLTISTRPGFSTAADGSTTGTSENCPRFGSNTAVPFAGCPSRVNSMSRNSSGAAFGIIDMAASAMLICCCGFAALSASCKRADGIPTGIPDCSIAAVCLRTWDSSSGATNAADCSASIVACSRSRIARLIESTSSVFRLSSIAMPRSLIAMPRSAILRSKRLSRSPMYWEITVPTPLPSAAWWESGFSSFSNSAR